LGADVAVLDVDVHSYRQFELEQSQMTADSTTAEIEDLGRRALEFEVDVTEPGGVAHAVEAVAAAWGRLDIVVCNAGGGIGAPEESLASTLDLDQFDAVVRRNLHGTVNTCVAVAPVMKARGYGKIITVSSQAGRRAFPDGGYAHYGTTKAAVIMYTRYLAQDLGPHGINVNCIAPGYIRTGRLLPRFERMGMDNVAASVALRRIGTPEDCARVVGFLAGPDSDYVTGVVIPVDGGSVL
jgi:3-oxoacyl-[acyl-carrier protein] reductase